MESKEQSVLLPRHQAVFDRNNGPNHRAIEMMNKAFTFYTAHHGGLKVIGQEHIPESGIIAPNHQSHLDHGAIGKAVLDSTGSHIHFGAKPDFWYDHWYGWFAGKLVEFGRGFPINRNSGWHTQPEVVKKITQIFADEELLDLSGEGTRAKNPSEPVKIKNGIAQLALAFGVPIVPTGIAGTKARNHMVVVFEEPLWPAKTIGRELLESWRSTALHTIAIRSLTHQLQDKIQFAKDRAEAERLSLILEERTNQSKPKLIQNQM
jgi:1-acyl-sn-glycerol-3-phosphate acyltransferase